LPREVSIKVGDPVTFANITPTVVGAVASVEYRDVDFLQLISFRSPVAMNGLRFVMVEIPTSVTTKKPK